MLKDVNPRVTHVTLIANPANPNAGEFSQFIETASRTIGLHARTAHVRNAAEIETAISGGAEQAGGGVIVFPDSLSVVHRDLIIKLVARHRLPAVYPFRVFPTSGGLVSYGLDFQEIYRQAAIYVDRILLGAKPTDLPVQAPNKFELVINLKTARALGIEVPPMLLARADDVIE